MRDMALILVIDLHVYLQQKLTKLLEEEGHNVIAIYPGRDLLGVNLRQRQFDYVLINSGVSPRFRAILQKNIEKYQSHCQILGAVYSRHELLQTING